jgi:hypothetical protein
LVESYRDLKVWQGKYKQFLAVAADDPIEASKMLNSLLAKL